MGGFCVSSNLKTGTLILTGPSPAHVRTALITLGLGVCVCRRLYRNGLSLVRSRFGDRSLLHVQILGKDDASCVIAFEQVFGIHHADHQLLSTAAIEVADTK